MAIEIPGGKRNLNMSINVMYAFKIACWALIFNLDNLA